MKKIIMSLLAAATLTAPALADSKITKGYHTMDAMGCMLLRNALMESNKLTIFWTSLLSILILTSLLLLHEFNRMLCSR